MAEVSKEVSKMVSIEEKCGLDMSSSQDLPKPDCKGTNHHNQANDLGNSYVFVTGADGLPDDVDNKDVEADGSSVLSQSDADGVKDQGPELNSQNENFDTVGGAFQLLNGVENRNLEQGNGDPCLVNVDNKDVEAECSSVLHESDAAGVKERGTELVSAGNDNVDAVSGELQPMNDGENRNNDQSNGDPLLVNVDNKDVESYGLSFLPESNAAGVMDHGAKLDSQNEKLEVVSGEFQPLNEVGNRNVEQSHRDPPLVNIDNKDVEAEGSSLLPESDSIGVKNQGAEMYSAINEDINAVSGEFQPLDEVGSRNVDQSNGDLLLVNVDNKDAEGEGLSVLPESDDVGVKNQVAELDSQNEKSVGGEFQSLNEAKNRNIAKRIGHPTLVNDSTSKHECSHKDGLGVQVSITDSLEKNTGKTESSKEAEVKVTDLDGEIESLTKGEVEKAMDQNGKVGVGEDEQEKFGDVIESVSPPGPESQVGASGLFAESGKNGKSNNILLHINSPHSANDECRDQSSLIATMSLETCQGSQDVVVDVVECELIDISKDSEHKVKLAREVAEAATYEVPQPTSVDLKSYPAHNRMDEKLAHETKTTLSLDVLENQLGDIAVGNNVQGVLGQIDESKIVVGNNDSHLQTVCDLILEGKNEDSCESEVNSEVDNGVQYPEKTDKQPDGSGVSKTKTEASMRTLRYSASNIHTPQSEIQISDAETIGTISSPHLDGSRSQVIEKTLPGYDSGIRSFAKASLDTVVLAGTKQTFQCEEPHAEAEVSSGKNKVVDSPFVTVGVKLEPEFSVHNFSAIGRGDKTDDVAVTYRTEVSDSFNVNKECSANSELVIEGVEGMVDQLDGAAGNGDEKLFTQENEDFETVRSNKISMASAGDCSANMRGREEESVMTKTKPFNFLIRNQRFDDGDLREQIRLAKLLVDEKTKLRDAIQIQIQEKRANSQSHGIDYEYAKSEARRARKLVRSKRMEIDSLQSVINKAKNALSIKDIDSQIYNMEHMIQHEILPLKEEKQFIREIKQLKQLREQLSSNVGSQDEIKKALEQREETEENLKILRKELDILKNRVLEAEATATEAEKKYDNEDKKIKELQGQFRAAADVRRAAYAQWHNLRKELSKKSEQFFKYKDAAAVAINYAFSRDTKALYHLCLKQVENFMELWNTNKEFRREYVKFNTRSTVRRFGTLDGRAICHDERPPILPRYANKRVNRMASKPVKVDLASEIPSTELKQKVTNENVTLDVESMKVTEPKNLKVKTGPASAVQGNGLASLSGMNLTDEVCELKLKLRDESESMRKEEEMRREEAEAKLKEQRRLEALAKANEARERKKRQAEKLQIRTEQKTQKEAEQREKEREKRLRKKERKKAVVTDANEVSNNCETAPGSESAVENAKDMPSLVPKKPQKHYLFTKQSKAKSVTPPVRNRNKKKLQQWMWVGVTSFVILVLFWLGNIGIFPNVALRRRGPLH